MTPPDDDMEPIKPDFDELDRPGAVRQRPHSDVQGQATRSPQNRQETGKDFDSDRRPGYPPAARRERQHGSAGLWLLWLVVLALAGGGGFVLYRQQQVVDGLEQELERARSLVDQSQKIAGQLEGQLSQTDATLAQSGNEMARALKKLDAQVRKLQKSSAAVQADAGDTVAGMQKKLGVVAQKQASTAAQLDIAAKSISQHTEALKTLGTLSEGLVADQSDLGLRIDSLDRSLDKRISSVAEQSVAKSEDALASRLQGIEVTLDKAQSEAASADAAVSELKVVTARQGKAVERAMSLAEAAGKAAASAGDRPAVSPDTVNTLQRQVDAVDATRRQLVQRLVNVDRRLNELTLQLDALAAQ